MNIDPPLLAFGATALVAAGGWVATVKANKDANDALRRDFQASRKETAEAIEPIVKLAEESLRQSTAAFRAIEELRASHGALAGKFERLDERTSFLKNTQRFKMPREPFPSTQESEG